MAIRVTKLTDKTAVTVLEFERACQIILENMQGVYQYLLLDLESVAQDILLSIAEVAGQMVTAANNLYEQYSQEVDNIQGILEEAFRAKHGEQENIKEMKKAKQEFDSTLAKAEVARKNALESEKKYQYYFEQAKKREEDLLEEQANPWKRAINFVTSFVGFEAYDLGAYKTAAEAAAGEKYKFLTEMQHYQSMRIDALKEIAEFTKRIEQCDDNTKLSNVVLESLQSAMGGLKNVAIVMMDAAVFWDSMRGHIESLQKHGLHKEIESVLKVDNTRQRPWKTEYFRRRAVTFYARWVALYKICKELRSNMSEAQKDLRLVVKLNPTKQEALANVRRLAKEFGPLLDEAIKQIEKDEEKSNRVKLGLKQKTEL